MNAPYSSGLQARSHQAVAAIAAVLLFLLSAPSIAQTADEESTNHGNTAGRETPVVRQIYSQAELDQMLAPIALYPDALLSQILMAATYPLEVVQAARWARNNPRLNGEAAVSAVAERKWDPSVKSLVAFPQVLSQMDTKLEWTESLGNAFLAQQAQVMDTVQALRRRAYAEGNVQSGEDARVVDRGRVILIEPADPVLIPVPYYDPWIVYGPWWWPAYPPVRWAAWPGYVYAPSRVTIVWGPAIWLPFGFARGVFDWHERRVYALPHAGAYPVHTHRIAPWTHRHRGAVRLVAAPPPTPAVTAVSPQTIGGAPLHVPTYPPIPAPGFQPQPQRIHTPLPAAAGPARRSTPAVMPGHPAPETRPIQTHRFPAPAFRPPQSQATDHAPGTSVTRAWPSPPAVAALRPAPAARPVRTQAERPASAGNARFAAHRGHGALR